MLFRQFDAFLHSTLYNYRHGMGVLSWFTFMKPLFMISGDFFFFPVSYSTPSFNSLSPPADDNGNMRQSRETIAVTKVQGQCVNI